MSEIKILDHGYLKFIESWGSDERVIESARMSTNKGFLGWGEGHCLECEKAGRLDPTDHLYLNYSMQKQAMGYSGIGENSGEGCSHCKGTGKDVGDEKLLKYLWEHKHQTPFEMAGFTIEVQAPIMVFREWHRHRVPFGYNEMSARYTPLPDLNYIPTIERLMINSKGSNKQAGTIKGAEELTEHKARTFQDSLKQVYQDQQALYEWALESGVPKELARIHLPVGRYSKMRATSNLRGWLNFLALRMPETAQWEIRQYANAVGDIVKELFPKTWELFKK